VPKGHRMHQHRPTHLPAAHKHRPDDEADDRTPSPSASPSPPPSSSPSPPYSPSQSSFPPGSLHMPPPPRAAPPSPPPPSHMPSQRHPVPVASNWTQTGSNEETHSNGETGDTWEIDAPEWNASEWNASSSAAHRELIHWVGGGCTAPSCSCSCSAPSVRCSTSGNARMCAPSGEMGMSMKFSIVGGQVKLRVRAYVRIGAGGTIRILGQNLGGFTAINLQRNWFTISSPRPSGVGIRDIFGSVNLGFTGIDFRPSVSSMLSQASRTVSAVLPGSRCISIPNLPQVCYSGSWANGITRTANAAASMMPRFRLPAPSGWNICNRFGSLCNTLSFP